MVVALASVLVLTSALTAQEDFQRHEDFSEDSAAACDCDCQMSGCRGSSCLTVREMWQREPAAGNQSQHFPYDTFRMYYYRRPYNSAHIREARRQQNHGYATHASGYSSDYSHRRDVFRRVDTEMSAATKHSLEDGYLEFVDWQNRQAAKESWKAGQEEQLSLSTEREKDERAASRLVPHADLR